MNTLEKMRLRANELHSAGHLGAAINLQKRIIDTAIAENNPQGVDYHTIGLMFYMARDYKNAATAFGFLKKYQPTFPDVKLNLALSLMGLGEFANAKKFLIQVSNDDGSNIDALSALTHAYYKTGMLDTALAYGQKILTHHHKAVQHKIRPAFTQTPPLFWPNRPKENVISFSLFGNNERYLVPAIRNAEKSQYIYPGWTCRFYCDKTVPQQTIQHLQSLDASVILMPEHHRFADALFWRFLVADDPTVTRFLIRDADSVINMREKAAVEEWLESGHHFHIMRDNPTHVDLILAGMWGGVTGVLPALEILLKQFSYNPITQSRNADQIFLGSIVWPLIKNSCCIHDSFYPLFGARPFPEGSELPNGQRVGDNVSGYENQSSQRIS